ncbi:MAG: PIN domain-containing protein [Gaiellaceae bacterium]
MSDGLLDTSVLIAADSSGFELPSVAAISVVTVGELRAGVLLAPEESIRQLRQRRLDAIRGAFAPLPVDEPVAERYGELLALARSQRRTAKATDLLIAATAAATGRTLYTLDRSQAELARAADIAVETF